MAETGTAAADRVSSEGRSWTAIDWATGAVLEARGVTISSAGDRN